MTSIKGVIVLLALLACANAFSIHCEPCDQVQCPVVVCEGVQLITDMCGCCEVCASGLGDACGGGSDLPCDESLVCAKPLALPQPRRSPSEGYVLDYWSSWGTCQDPAEVHKCQLEGDNLCSYQGICLPDGDGHTCLCDLLWTGEDCKEPEILCPHNQEHTTCGTSCPKMCGEEEPMFCTYQCVVGCQCPSGWWQNPDGSCVEEESQCDKLVIECPHNQEFTTCGTACPNTCGEEAPMLCTMQCVVGCQCPAGWWQNPDGSCVEQESQCEIVGRCPYNQEYTNCGTACPKICGEPEPEFCTEQCIMDVCQCPWGWWQKSDGSCVQQEWECDLIIEHPGPIAGGYGKWQDVTDEVQNIADAVRDDVEQKYGRLKKYQAHSFKSQVVAGTNYNIRVDTGMKTYLEIVVYQHWSGTNELSSAKISEVRVVPVLSPDCQDKHDSCEGWASTGECCNNQGYMLSNCANSCGQCGDKPDLSCACKDKNKDCKAWAADGECCKNPEYMLENCPESCSQCGEINEVPGCTCMNFDPNCDGWANGGECESNPGFMSKHCAQACGQCEVGPVCTVECPEDCHCDDDMCICPDEPEPVLGCDDCPPECICGDYGDCLCQIIEPWVGGGEE